MIFKPSYKRSEWFEGLLEAESYTKLNPVPAKVWYGLGGCDRERIKGRTDYFRHIGYLYNE